MTVLEYPCGHWEKIMSSEKFIERSSTTSNQEASIAIGAARFVLEDDIGLSDGDLVLIKDHEDPFINYMCGTVIYSRALKSVCKHLMVVDITRTSGSGSKKLWDVHKAYLLEDRIEPVKWHF